MGFDSFHEDSIDALVHRAYDSDGMICAVSSPTLEDSMSRLNAPAAAPILIDLGDSFVLDSAWPSPRASLVKCSHFHQESLPAPATGPSHRLWGPPVLH